MYMDHIFTRSSVSGRLDCLHVLAVVNSAAMNVGLNVSFWIRVPFRYIPRRGIAESFLVTLFLVFWGNSILFSILAVPTYSSTASVGAFPKGVFNTPNGRAGFLGTWLFLSAQSLCGASHCPRGPGHGTLWAPWAATGPARGQPAAPSCPLTEEGHEVFTCPPIVPRLFQSWGLLGWHVYMWSFLNLCWISFIFKLIFIGE